MCHEATGSSFTGSAGIERDGAALHDVIRGAGSDRGTGSRTRVEVTWRLVPEAHGRQTRVDMLVEHSLQGALAQFSRSGIAADLGRRLAADFAANLNARLAGKPLDQQSNAQLNVGRLLWLWARSALVDPGDHSTLRWRLSSAKYPPILSSRPAGTRVSRARLIHPN